MTLKKQCNQYFLKPNVFNQCRLSLNSKNSNTRAMKQIIDEAPEELSVALVEVEIQ
jgi:hypothetical protein